jgi:hypothetical protein
MRTVTLQLYDSGGTRHSNVTIAGPSEGDYIGYSEEGGPRRYHYQSDFEAEVLGGPALGVGLDFWPPDSFDGWRMRVTLAETNAATEREVKLNGNIEESSGLDEVTRLVVDWLGLVPDTRARQAAQLSSDTPPARLAEEEIPARYPDEPIDRWLNRIWNAGWRPVSAGPMP